MSERTMTVADGTATTNPTTEIPAPRTRVTTDSAAQAPAAAAPPTPPTSMIPAPRAPIHRTVPGLAGAGTRPPVEARTDASTTAPTTARTPTPTTGSSWVEHPLRHRIRAIMRGGPLPLEEQHAAARAGAVSQLHRSDAISAQARHFTGMR